MRKDLREGDTAGEKSHTDIAYNDLDELCVRPNFFKLYKLSSVKCWHVRGRMIQGLHLTYTNPLNGNILTMGPHVCNQMEGRSVSSATLELDSEEYLEEVRGFHDSTVNYILLRTNKGKYAEFGNPNQGTEFRFRVPKGNHILCLSYGFTPTALKFLEMTLAPIAYMPYVSIPVVPSEPIQGIPRIIQRTDYIGMEDRSGTVLDDFFTLNMHPFVRSGDIHIIQVNALHSRVLLGLQIVYQIGDEAKNSDYNFSLDQYPEAARYSLEINEGETITEVACLTEGRYISSLSIITSTGNHVVVGYVAKGDKMQQLTPKGCQVLAFRGMFDEAGVQALMMYYL